MDLNPNIPEEMQDFPTSVIEVEVMETAMEENNPLSGTLLLDDRCAKVNEYVWMCNSCPAFFRTEMQLNEHGNFAHQYWCLYCSHLTFAEKQDFMDHFCKFDHFGVATKEKLARMREKGIQVGTSQISLSTQTESLQTEPPRVKKSEVDYYVCLTCTRGYLNISELEKHYMKLHKAKRIKESLTTLQCKCRKTFKGFVALKKHCREGHISELQSEVAVDLCNVCSQPFAEKSLLQTHYRESHNKDLVMVTNTVEAPAKPGVKREIKTEMNNDDQDFKDEFSDLVTNVEVIMSAADGNVEPNTRKRRSIRRLQMFTLLGDDNDDNDATYSDASEIMNARVITRDENGTSFVLEFECLFCDRRFESKKGRNSHVSQAHKSAAKKRKRMSFSVGEERKDYLKCKACDESFKSRFNLRYHEMSRHGVPVSCNLCKLVCENQIVLSRHKKAKHGAEDDTFSCSKCKLVFKSKLKLKTHTMIAHKRGGKPAKLKLTCCVSNCQQPISLVSAYGFYPMSDENGLKVVWVDAISDHFPKYQPKFEDKICSYHFTVEDFEDDSESPSFETPLKPQAVPTVFTANENKEVGKMQTWKRAVHPEELIGKTVQEKIELEKSCQLCLQKFLNANSYRRHMELIHGVQPSPVVVAQMRTTVCEICGDAVNKHYYRNHLAKHRNMPPFECPECDKKFFSTACLNVHKKSYHGEKIVCTICGNEFRSNCGFRYHMANTHPDSNSKPCTCKVCGKEFKNDKLLRRHYHGVHLKEKQHKPCTYCKKMCHSKMALMDHMNAAHLKEKTFVCITCGKCYTQNKQCWKHCKVIHKIKVNYGNMDDYVRVVPWMEGLGRSKNM